MKALFRRLPVLVGLLLLPGILFAQPPGHNFGRWEKDIHAYELQSAAQPPPPDALVFIGSSTIARWKTLAQDFTNLPVVNRGFGGSEIVDATHFADRVIIPYHPKMVLLRAGGNDLWAGKSVAQVFADFKDFVATVQAKLPQTTIVFISLSPSLARWKQHDQEKELNTLIAGYLADQPNRQYIETYDLPLGTDGQPRAELFVADNLHFNAAGYQLLAARVRPYLTK